MPGQCEVRQGGLEAFRLASRELKVEGLMEELEGLQELKSFVSTQGSTDQSKTVPEKKEPSEYKKTNFSKESMVAKLARKISIEDQDEITSDNIYFGESEGEIPELVIDMDKDDGQNTEECNDLKSELNMPVKSRQFKCEFCSASYKKNSHVHEGKRYPCEQCGHIASTLGNLTMHKKSMHDSIRYKCYECVKEFTQNGSLLRHKQVIHTEMKEMLECNQCDHREFLLTKLAKHKLRMHEGVWHECAHCNFRANHAFMLKKHLQTKHTVFK